MLRQTSVNLPRWGLKLKIRKLEKKRSGCKFTPLGFETNKSRNRRLNFHV